MSGGEAGALLALSPRNPQGLGSTQLRNYCHGTAVWPGLPPSLRHSASLLLSTLPRVAGLGLVLCAGGVSSLDLELRGRSGEGRKDRKDKLKQVGLSPHLGLEGWRVLVRQRLFVDRLVGF